MGKYVDYYCSKDRLRNMVDRIILKHYGWIPQKEYDDFYSIAGQTLWYCEQKFDGTKGKDFEKYLVDSLYRKFKTQITFLNRKKRCSNSSVLSIEKIIDDESDLTIGDMIATKEDNELSPLAQRYIDSLSKIQKQVAELIMIGYEAGSIKAKLGLSNERYAMIFQRMRTEEKIEPLNKLKGVKR